MTTQGRRRKAEFAEGAPEREPSGRTADLPRGGRPKLEPMQINEAKVIWIGIGCWAAAFLIMLPFRKTLIDAGHGWWLYTCLAGAGLGMVGLPMVGRRKSVMARETEHGRAVAAGGHDDDLDDPDDLDDLDDGEPRGGRAARTLGRGRKR